MIRRKEPAERLFYSSDELCRNGKGRYARLDAAVEDWDALAAPLMKAFSQERNGRPTDPVVYLKIFLVGYNENISDDTDLAERISDSLSIRAFLGYGLSETTPDHSSISRVRTKLDGCMEEVLENVVKLCYTAGLVGGSECAVDSALVKANASPSNLVHVETGERAREYVARLKEEDPSEKAKVTNANFVCKVDPDARLATKPSAPPNLYYKVTHVTDSKSQIILSAVCSKSDVHDVHCAREPLERALGTLRRLGKGPTTTVADSAYDDGDFHAYVESLGATPVTNHYSRERKDQIPKSDFRYDAERDLYICPSGHHLLRVRLESGRSQYKAKKEICQNCPFKSNCIARGDARMITRYPNEAARARNVARCHTTEGRNALRRRKHVVEPPFGHMKQYGGLRRVNCRTLRRAKVKFLCAAVSWNLLKLAAGLRSSLKTILEASIGPLFGSFDPWNGARHRSLVPPALFA